MNIDNLTIGQAKELTKILGADDSNQTVTSSAIGKYAIVRSRNEGINFGIIDEADRSGVILSDAQRIYYHKPKDSSTSWYEGVAETGLSSDSVISSMVSKKIIIEDYSITMCSDEAIKSIKSHTPNGS